MVRAVVLNTQMEPAGAQRMAAAVFDHLRSRGHEAEWWSLYLKRPAWESQPGVHCISLTAPKSALDYAQILTKYVQRLRDFRPNVIFGFTHYANTLGLAAGCLAGVPVRIASQQNIRESYPWLARVADSALGTLGVYTSNVMCSRAVLESFSRNHNSYCADARVIPNGSKQNAPARTTHERNAAKKALGLDPTDALVIAIGRLTAQKRHQLLIDSMKGLPGTHLLIAGEGEDRPDLERRIFSSDLQNRVRLLGNVSPDEVGRLLLAADVFAMASEFEGLSLALVEAMAAGLPIVASDIPTISDVIVDDSGEAAGILVGSAEPEDWCCAISEMTRNDDVAERYGRRARSRARAFDIDQSALAYVGIAESQVQTA